MHWKSVVLGAAVASAAFLFAGRAFSEDPPKPEDAEAMKLRLPGPQHEALNAFTGSWEGKGTYQGMEWTSKQTARIVMGGRFLQMNEEITVPTPQGPMVIHSLGYVGYDNVQKFVHMGLNDESTAFASDEGQYDAARKVHEMRGIQHRPGGDVKYRMTIGDVANGAFHVEMFFDEGSGEQPTLVGDYHKK